MIIGAHSVKRLRFTRVTSAVLIAALTAGPLAAQQSSPQPTAEIPKLVENIDVHVIGVDVVVTDKKGNAVTGLTKDDFQIFENGQEKTISNFYEIEGKPAKAVVNRSRPRRSCTSEGRGQRAAAAPHHFLHRQPLAGALQPQPRLQADEGVRQGRHAPRRRGHGGDVQPQPQSARAVHARRRADPADARRHRR